MKIHLATLALTALLPLAACGGSTHTVTVQNRGSDTMLEVAGAWAEAYEQVHKDVVVEVSGGGSTTGISGIIDGTVDIANCSREMQPAEIAHARKNGHEPILHKVGYDGIAIFVHKDNPIASVTMEQLKQIYGEGGTITKWSQLGVTMPAGVSDDIVLVSRQNNSGTYGYFAEHVLAKGNFRLGTRDQSGSKDVVDLVSQVKGAIGYSGLASATSAVKMVPVGSKPGTPPVTPTNDTILDGSYPIARPLFMYTSGEPKGATKDYLDWIVSDAGQRVLASKGYPPLRKL